jgi:hypothetical protein
MNAPAGDHDERAAANARYRAFMARYGRTIYYEVLRRHQGDPVAFGRAIAAGLGLAREQAVRAHRDRDELTVLQCAFGCRATKKIVALTPEGVHGYACGKWFATAPLDVDGFGGMVGALEYLLLQPRMFVIRGELIDGRHPGRVRKKCHPDAGDPNAPISGPSLGAPSGLTLTAFP